MLEQLHSFVALLLRKLNPDHKCPLLALLLVSLYHQLAAIKIIHCLVTAQMNPSTDKSLLFLGFGWNTLLFPLVNAVVKLH